MSLAAPIHRVEKDAAKPRQLTSQPSGQLITHQNQNDASVVQSEFNDLRHQSTTQLQLQNAANVSSQNRQMHSFQQIAQNSARTTQFKAMSSFINARCLQRVDDEDVLQAKTDVSTVQREVMAGVEGTSKLNNTGLPNHLKSGIESLSGMSMDHVKVHYNSAQPAQLNAHAYAQGNDIHLAPGQEQHLPHEAWHVVQQAQGRVRATLQMKGDVPINDDKALEDEADLMGARALQTKAISDGHQQKLPTSLSTNVAQRVVDEKIRTLRIGIVGDAQNLGIYAANLPAKTYVWIMSNKAVAQDALDASGVTPGHNESSPNQIVIANLPKISIPKFRDEASSGGAINRKIYHSSAFEIPRATAPTNRNEVDYSFLRYAALKSYGLWHGATGTNLGWPSMTDANTILETIDSDLGGITGSSRTSIPTDSMGSISTGWLAEAGMYSWDWSEVKDHPNVVKKFNGTGVVDTAVRDAALSKFSEKYTEAEKIAREGVSSNMFNIYFPEPATRLSSDALVLLANSGFGAMAVTRGQQIGFKRESIGLIAGLVYLDELSSKNFSKSKSKLRFNPSYLVTTGLGKRKDAYVSVFNEWYLAATPSLNDVDFGKLSTVAEFDQSYLKENVAQDVNKWHTASYDAMKLEKAGNVGKTFFHPK